MSDDSLARSPSAAPPSAERDYDAIHATIVATERGRWFLEQHADRYRAADTGLVLAAIERVEAALRGANTVPDAGRLELAALLEIVGQAHDDVIGQQGDPAASGEAAIAEFRHAAEQIQELVLAAQEHPAGSDLAAQLSFQINRLAGAGDRLERSVAALRLLLEVLETLDQRLCLMVAGAAPVAAGDAAVATDPAGPLADWSVPAEDTAPASEPEPTPEVALWDLTVDAPEPVKADVPELPPAADAAEPVSEAAVVDWAFDPGDTPREPAAEVSRSLPPLDIAPTPPRGEQPVAEPLMSALERLEAREYRRRPMPSPEEPAATRMVAPEEPPTEQMVAAEEPPATWMATPARPAEPVAPLEPDGLDDLLMGGGPSGEPREPAAAEPPAMDWTVAPTQAVAAAEPALDADLFEGGDSGQPAPLPPDLTSSSEPDPLAAAAPEPAAELPPEPVALAPPVFAPSDPSDGAPPSDASTDEPPPAPESGADTPSVLERLEHMRSAIAALMDEVNEKTARRTPPPPAS
jgi:hypothetical protein